jgi:hypothetical protein
VKAACNGHIETPKYLAADRRRLAQMCLKCLLCRPSHADASAGTRVFVMTKRDEPLFLHYNPLSISSDQLPSHTEPAKNTE